MTDTPHNGREFSCEFFPPKTPEGAARLDHVREQLAALGPRFFSVTYGAGGTTQARTLETVLRIQHESGIPAAPHLSCVGSTREQIRGILDTYRTNGIQRIVALRGDLPSGMRDIGEFRHANDLVEFVRAETGDHFRIEVAAYPEVHPQARNAEEDLRHFKRKIEAGANSAITQYFFNPDAYFRFIDDCARCGIDVPIIPGIMPITQYTQLARFSDACGAEIPRWMRKRLEGMGDDRDAIRAFGLDVISALCQRLLDAGAPGLHFYTMNQAEATQEIWERLGLSGA
ncbi:methylenetetrahydrofolate reductase [NAD(P)H] [Acidihalobacter ferrooxydans]|uniref:Methylenetetrahydrofolate reductase n=1 Tax=Acidihalobacter ferrooxydans TaxID=1765967 RepID=A0A1P8UKB4_9GAMM|nr:methylenetetrahydrofolate reductase [NAD(P)H] [Acidihalobacter ferrooxydans]APZ44286.1 methylenetetrahydrofolate reductase [NAD(P)H] [Acidihalobacter ferrooxydans]